METKPTASLEQIKQFNDTCILNGKDPRDFPWGAETIRKYGKKENKNGFFNTENNTNK